MRFDKLLLSGAVLSADCLIAIAAGCGSQSSPSGDSPEAEPSSAGSSPVITTTATVSDDSNRKENSEEAKCSAKR